MIGYQGRYGTAGLTGSEWIRCLNDMVEKPCFSDEQQRLLTHAQYAAEVEFDSEGFIDSCERWINSLPARSRHVSA